VWLSSIRNGARSALELRFRQHEFVARRAQRIRLYANARKCGGVDMCRDNQ